MDRRRLYGDEEQSRFRTADGGARLIDILNGAGSAGGINALDRFNAYSFNTFIAAKYKGFSISNEWWFRYLTDFETLPAGGNAEKIGDRERDLRPSYPGRPGRRAAARARPAACAHRPRRGAAGACRRASGSPGR